MTCPKCERTNPDDAQYCIYCATRLTPETPTVQAAPATGPTTRLNPEQAPSYTLPATPPPAPQPAAPPLHHGWSHNKEATGAIWLIGLAILFLTGFWWPGILVLIGATSFVSDSARGRHQQAVRNLIFFLGLAVLGWTQWWWPGILVLVGLMMLLGPHGGRRHCWW